MATRNVNEQTFPSEVLLSKEPVAVDFYADWCGPCQALGPILEKMSVGYQGKVKIAKVDIDASPQLAARYGIRGVPTMLFFKDGKLVDQVVGLLLPAQLAVKLDALAA